MKHLKSKLIIIFILSVTNLISQDNVPLEGLKSADEIKTSSNYNFSSKHKEYDSFIANHFVPVSFFAMYSSELKGSLDLNFNLYLIEKVGPIFAFDLIGYRVYSSWGFEVGPEFIKGQLGAIFQCTGFSVQFRMAIWSPFESNKYFDKNELYFGPEVAVRLAIFVVKAGYMYSDENDKFVISFGVGF